MEQVRVFLELIRHAARNLLPILLVVGFFQLVVMQQVPEGLGGMLAGLLLIVFGVALFLQGLELGIFPVGKNLSNEFTRKGSLGLLIAFGFALGFSAVVAEPALIAVAIQAQEISAGRIDALTLRLIIAVSVGLVVALGILRVVLGHPIYWYVITGYLLVIGVTFFAPEEIVGLAYDSGGVTTNVVTVPLIAALGIGLASAIRGRNALSDGFGLVALAVMVPMVTVQIYGIVVYGGDWVAADTVGRTAMAAGGAPDPQRGLFIGMFLDLMTMFRDVLPIILVILIFQYLVLRRPLPHAHRAFGGFMLVIVGLYAFVLGLKLGLFPIGRSMAEQLVELDQAIYIYLFAFLIGFATTMAEPALIAISRQAEVAGRGRLDGGTVRILVALGVAIGMTVGSYRIVHGDPIHTYIMVGYLVVILTTLFTPRHILALAYDLGGVTTSEVTVPLVTALGIGLATNIEGRNVLIDGFGLIAFASLFPILTVMFYAIAVEAMARRTGAIKS